MAYLKWDGTCDVGHPIIDHDHAAMAAAINELARFYQADGGAATDIDRRAKLAAAIAEMREVTAKHFQSEQWIMENAGYPTLNAHRRQHEDLLAEFDAFSAQFQATPASEGEHVLRFLRDWFVFHVQTWDEAFARWLAARPEH